MCVLYKKKKYILIKSNFVNKITNFENPDGGQYISSRHFTSLPTIGAILCRVNFRR